MQPPAGPELVLEPLERRLSDRQFALVAFGVAVAAAAVLGTLIALPPGFGILLTAVVAYPVVKVVREAWRAHRSTGPRLLLAPAFLQCSELRFAWRDVSDVSVGPSARVRDRRDRVKVRLNRLVPVRPTDSALRGAGLELGDQYFDFAIPPCYELGPNEIARQIETRRGALRRAPAEPPAAPDQAPPPEPASAVPAGRRPASRPRGARPARRRPPEPGPR